jgi:hypothetical protein
MSTTASRLIVSVAIGSRSHSGAPTSAASGMMMSASFTSGAIVCIERTSPRTRLKHR